MATSKKWTWFAAVFIICLLWACAAYSWVRTRSGPLGWDPVRVGLTFIRSLTIFAPPWLLAPSAWLVIGLWCASRLRPRWQPSELRSLFLAAAAAWVLAAGGVEAVLTADEIAFEREARSAGSSDYRRDRRWTLQYGELVWADGRGWCADH